VEFSNLELLQKGGKTTTFKSLKMRGLPGSDVPIIQQLSQADDGWTGLRCVYIWYSHRICQADIYGLPEPEATSRQLCL